MVETTRQKTFNYWWRQCVVVTGPRIAKDARLGARHVRSARLAAYDFGKAYLEMINMDQGQMLSLVRSTHKGVDEWLDEWFAPIEMLGEDYRELVTAISKGMTRKQYESRTPTMFLAREKSDKRKSRSRRVIESDLPSTQLEGMSLAAQNKVLRLENAELRDRLRQMRGEYGRMRNRLAKYERSLRRMLKDQKENAAKVA